MADTTIGSAVGQLTGGLKGFSMSSVTSGIVILLVVLLVAMIVGVIGWIVIMNRRYNKKIIIFENIAGQGYVPIGRDTARVVKIGDGGEEVLYLRKRKVYRSAYGRKIGTNTYAFAIGSDGYWYNITFGSLETALKKLNIDPIDRDMRYMHVAIRRNIADRYNKKNWFKENIGLIVGIISILLVLIFMWLLADKYLTISSSANQAMEASKAVSDRIADLLGKMDNICAGGTGLK